MNASLLLLGSFQFVQIYTSQHLLLQTRHDYRKLGGEAAPSHQKLSMHACSLSLSYFNTPTKRNFKLGMCHPISRQLHRLDALHDDGSGCAATVANRRNAVFARLQLVQQCDQDPRPGASQGVAEGDGSPEGVDAGTLQSENL